MKRIASVALLLLVAACGSNSGGSKSDAADPPSATTAAPAAGATSSANPPSAAGTSAAGKSDGKNPVDGATFCSFLDETEPDLKAIGSGVGAQASFTIALAGWVGQHEDQKPRTAADLDAVAQASCPKSRAKVVADMGYTSFQEALG